MLPTLAAEPDTRHRDILTTRQREITTAVPGLFTVVAPYIDEPLLSLDSAGKLWLIASRRHDPLTRADAGYVIPKGPLTDMRRLAAAGIRVEQIVIAHEVRRDATAERLIPLLAGGPRRCAPEVARELVGPVPAHPAATRVATSMEAALRAVGGGAAFLARSGRRAVSQLDPIIFGVIGADRHLVPGQPALWIALTAWEW
jgi:hypothetical protein